MRRRWTIGSRELTSASAAAQARRRPHLQRLGVANVAEPEVLRCQLGACAQVRLRRREVRLAVRPACAAGLAPPHLAEAVLDDRSVRTASAAVSRDGFVCRGAPPALGFVKRVLCTLQQFAF